MSTIAITFSTQALDFSPLTRGAVTVTFNDGNQDFALSLNLTTGISSFGNFSEVSWVDGNSGEDDQQAQNFASAFNRDYSSVGTTGGGLQQSNLNAVAVDNVVTITALSGTFSTTGGANNYSGNVLVVTGFTVDNSTQIPPLALSVIRSTTGDCDNIQYSASVTGGQSNYTLYNGTTELQSSWDGTSFNFNLSRSSVSAQIRVVDSLSTETSSTVVIPRKLAIGEFNAVITQFESSSDIMIENTNPVAGTDPIEYSLDAQGSTTGGAYQTSNAFAGILPGLYELFVRDVYGCEVTKTIEVNSLQDSGSSQVIRYFDIMQANALIFSECPTFDHNTKKNFDNTLSWNELSGIKYEAVQYFHEGDNVGTQFKSSYDFHQITLHRCGAANLDIFPVLVQQNLGAKEKVDCKLFSIDGQTGVYFDGGNEYEPDTTTVIDASEYVQFLPKWAEEGQIVSIDGLGSFTIDSTGYDQTLERGYFVINVSTSNTDGLVQVTRNIQDYNVYEFYINISDISSSARVVVEKGFSTTGIDGNAWVSELIVNQEDSDDFLLIEASSTKNRADLVFQSRISFLNRMEGVFRPFFEGDVENFDGDSRLYPLTENLYQRYRLELDRLTAKQVYKLCIWCLLDGFKVNNVPLRATNFPEIESLGDSNWYSMSIDLGYTGDIMAIQQDEIVLSVSTGVEGGGSNSVLPPPLSWGGQQALNIDSGFITIGGELVTV